MENSHKSKVTTIFSLLLFIGIVTLFNISLTKIKTSENFPNGNPYLRQAKGISFLKDSLWISNEVACYITICTGIHLSRNISDLFNAMNSFQNTIKDRENILDGTIVLINSFKS